MTRPPALAEALLTRFGPVEDALIGDVYEEWGRGRSRAWFWRQALSAIGCSVVRDVLRQPARACGAVLTGWAAVALVFMFGDTIAYGLAGLVWHWSRGVAADTGDWGPFRVTSLVVSYGGFAVSAAIVARLHRRRPTMLLLYAAATAVFLLAAAVILEVPIRRGVPVPVPHPLFYAISVTLPYQWHSGILLVPLTMLLSGALMQKGPAVEDRPQ